MRKEMQYNIILLSLRSPRALIIFHWSRNNRKIVSFYKFYCCSLFEITFYRFFYILKIKQFSINLENPPTKTIVICSPSFCIMKQGCQGNSLENSSDLTFDAEAQNSPLRIIFVVNPPLAVTLTLWCFPSEPPTGRVRWLKCHR